MRVAIVHYWLVGMRGGERVIESLCRIFPEADIYTHVVDRNAISKLLARHTIRTTFIAKLPFARRLYPKYLPLMPQALEALDLTGYDLIISSEAGPAKGVIAGPGALHICYCHSPMRYIWDQYHVYRRSSRLLTRFLMPFLSHYLRIWDVTSAARVDLFLANSQFVASRVSKYYRRSATVVAPPVAVEEFCPVSPGDLGDFYLWVGELVTYKRPDIAIDAFNRNGKKLVVIGDGPERKKLEKLASDNIAFLGKAPFDVLKRHYATCKALVFPGEEDFGIVPVEVQAAGRPVIAFGKGGVLETVVDGKTGLFFSDPSADGLNEAIARFEATNLGDTCLESCQDNAEKFSEENFRKQIEDIVRAQMEQKAGGAEPA